MADNDDVFQTRMRLFECGYLPIPDRGKIPVLKGWNLKDYAAKNIEPSGKGDTAKKLKRWGKIYPDAESTGVRIEHGLAALDFDIDDAAATTFMLDWLTQHLPDVAKRGPTRYGGGDKMAIFVRLSGDDFVRLGSRKYHRPDETAEHYHQIETFGGKPTSGGHCSRQFAVHGPRSYASDGAVETSYAWADDFPTLMNTPLAQLPEITRDQVLELLTAFELWAEQQGWIRIDEADAEGDGVGEDVFDIDEATRFDVYQGEQQISYTDLETLIFTRSDLRVSPTFVAGVTTDRLDRCSVFWSKRFDCPMIKDWKTNDRHYLVELQPLDTSAFGAKLKQIAEQLGIALPKGGTNWRASSNSGEIKPPRPPHNATMQEKYNWLLQCYGYEVSTDMVVDLFETVDERCRIKPVAFQREYRSWREEKKGPRGGITYLHATDIWEVNENRIGVAGVRMCPDKTFPTYAEGGKLYKNRYRKPVHSGAGDIAPFVTFMERFLPDQAEREWFYDALAHKQAKPWIPGISVIFVADTEDGRREGRYGTGRGMLFRVLYKLFGEEYTQAEDFDIIAGNGSQAIYTDWRFGSILVTIDEAMTSPTAHRRGERKSIYEALKNAADPVLKRYKFKGKYKPSFDGYAYSSLMVATNHANAIAIPPGDRRFSVLNNGREILPEEAKTFAAWIDDDGNIAELSRWLERRDLTKFDPYLALKSAAKTEMIDRSYSQVEQEMIDLSEDDTRGLVFTRVQVEREIENIISGGRGTSWQQWRGTFEGAWDACVRLLKTDAGSPCRIRVGGIQTKLYCFANRHKEARLLDEMQRRHEAAKWGMIGSFKDGLTVITGGLPDEPKSD